jgi:hypothetical protein
VVYCDTSVKDCGKWAINVFVKKRDTLLSLLKYPKLALMKSSGGKDGMECANQHFEDIYITAISSGIQTKVKGPTIWYSALKPVNFLYFFVSDGL